MTVDQALTKYEAVIGLEVHAQLKTKSKIFSPDSAAFGGEPNTHVDPVSLGHPGTLPVLNAEAVRFAVRMGLATDCRIRERSYFARKHYFYPDLPKGYQISQFDAPICEDGHLDLDVDGPGEAYTKRVGITRIHLEEDAGKSLHDQDPYDTLVDHNRCGVPLIEIVSEPDIRTAREAYVYLQQIRQIVRYLGICDGNMEEGSLRCDANISVRPVGQDALGTKAEVKNMNSLRNVERAVEYEIQRQIRILEEGGTIEQETRLWNAERLETRSMRSKERAHDYRYFPDPDLPPILITDNYLAEIRSELPELPARRRQRFIKQLGLPAYDAGVLTDDRATGDYFESTLKSLEDNTATAVKATSNFVMGDVLRSLKESSGDLKAFPIQPDRLARMISLRLEDRISSSAATEIFEAMISDPREPHMIAQERNLFQVSDEASLRPVVLSVLQDHLEQVQQYLDGKEAVLGFFVGKTMKAFSGAADPKLVRSVLIQEIKRLS